MDRRDGTWTIVAIEDGGEERWSTGMASMVFGSVSVVDGTAYVHSGEGVHALDAETGDEVWSTDVTGRFGYAPAVVDDTVYVGSQKSASTLDAASGDERWTFTGEDPDRGSLTSVGSVVGDGIVYFGTTREERIVPVDADTGEKRWAAGHDWLTQPPALAHETLYAGIEPGAVHTDISEHTGSRIVGIDATTGEDRWTFDRYGTEEFGLTPAVGGDVVYARTLGGLYAIEARSGELRWEFDGPFGLPWGEDGPMARPPSQSEQIVSAPAIVDGTVFVGSPAGGVYAVGEA